MSDYGKNKHPINHVKCNVENCIHNNHDCCCTANEIKVGPHEALSLIHILISNCSSVTCSPPLPSRFRRISSTTDVYKRQAPNSGLTSIDKILDYKGKIDVMVMCGGSATDLPVQVPEIAAHFNTIDSFDTHAKIPEYFAKVDAVAKTNSHLAMISSGWDPGLFSLNRVLMASVLPEGKTYTFWGTGVSQGHSDAIRRVQGVADAKQYTVPVPEALESVRKGENKELTTREKHRRVCYVVPKEGADLKQIEHDIVTMPNYFADYDTEVHFISQEELNHEPVSYPHLNCQCCLRGSIS